MLKLGFLDRATKSLKEVGTETIIYGEITSNPPVPIVDAQGELALKERVL